MNKKIRNILKAMRDRRPPEFRKPIAPPGIRMKSKKDYSRSRDKKLVERQAFK